MKFLDTLHDFFEQLETRKFYQYLTIGLVTITLITGGIVYFFYSSVDAQQQKLEELNDMRSREIKSILGRMEHVKKQRAEVNTILAQEEAFKIGGYFNSILSLPNIAQNKKEETTTQINLDNEYNESILTAKFVDITMKQLTELLNIIEGNRRVYTKALEIQKSAKTPNTIDVSLTIATLQPRTATNE